jgi:hypothetical protein
MQAVQTSFASVPIVGAVAGAALLIVGIVAALIVFSRLLQHRETLKMLDLGLDTDATLRLRERWRNRAGLLHGVKLLVVGVVLIVMSQASSIWLAMVMPKREFPTLGLTAPPLLIFLGLLLAAVGAVYLVAYAIWSRHPLFEDERTRRDPGASSGQEPPT